MLPPHCRPACGPSSSWHERLFLSCIAPSRQLRQLRTHAIGRRTSNSDTYRGVWPALCRLHEQRRGYARAVHPETFPRLITPCERQRDGAPLCVDPVHASWALQVISIQTVCFRTESGCCRISLLLDHGSYAIRMHGGGHRRHRRKHGFVDVARGYDKSGQTHRPLQLLRGKGNGSHWKDT